ncbi:Uncharacterised protein [Staphylococcus delphini]|nr:Uncharacterised protein [Staphylococcus delphini]
MNRVEREETLKDKKIRRCKDIREIVRNVMVILTGLIALIKMLVGG